MTILVVLIAWARGSIPAPLVLIAPFIDIVAIVAWFWGATQ